MAEIYKQTYQYEEEERAAADKAKIMQKNEKKKKNRRKISCSKTFYKVVLERWHGTFWVDVLMYGYAYNASAAVFFLKNCDIFQKKFFVFFL